MHTLLDVNQVSIQLGGATIIDDVSFRVDEGQIACLLGPSGCGKTTLLRSVAGFQSPHCGDITMDGRCIADATRSIPPEQRQIGMVFQDLALFPHLSVAKNIAFGMRAFSSAETRQRVDELLALVDLQHLRDQYPHQLSGGQQQRIALIRAMAPRPQLLLLDEPFSSQDSERRVQLAHEIRNILKRDRTTAILVTHDQREAFAIADQIGVLNSGKLHQWDTAYSLYHRPADKFVAKFIGEGAFVRARVVSNTTLDSALGKVSGQFGDLETDTEVDLLVRPEDISYAEDSTLKGELIEKDFRGAEHRYTLRMPDDSLLLCIASGHHDHAIGDSIGICIAPQRAMVFRR